MSGPPRRPLSGRSSDPFASSFFRSADRSSSLTLIAVVVAALLIILWVLFLPPFGLLRGSSQQAAGDGYSVSVVRSVPALPTGLAPASRFYQIFVRKTQNGAVNISLPLIDPKATSRGLSFYTFQGGTWQRLGNADPSGDATSAGGQLQRLPPNLILLKRLGSALQVMGGLPAGKTLSPEATAELTVLNPAGFTPQEDGTLSGDQPPAVPGRNTMSCRWWPR